MSENKYPLWCVDTGDKTSEHRYSGPFDTEKEAKEKMVALAMDMRYPTTVRRCRRIKASEIDYAKHVWDDLIEHLDDDLGSGGAPDNVWADWSDDLIDLLDTAGLLVQILDAKLSINAYICEGDE